MTHDPITRGIGPARDPGRAAPPGAARTDGAAFRALLDELQEKARRLKQEGERLSVPEDLPGVVDRAGDSIKDALSLSDRLLEAYRAAQRQTAPENPGTDPSR